jgi:hypothetical protein
MVKAGVVAGTGKPLAGHEVFPAMLCPRALTPGHSAVHPVVADEGQELLTAEVLVFQVMEPLAGPR